MDTAYQPPAGRASPAAITAMHERFLADRVMAACIEAMPELVLVLNHQRQVVAVNAHLLSTLGVDHPEQLLGSRPGEILHCIHASEGADGCGTGRHCQVCGAALAIDACRRLATRQAQECLMAVSDGGAGSRAIELEVVTAPLTIEGVPLILCAMTDISDRKRREALERVFFHDVMNTAEGLVAITELMQFEGARPERLGQLSRTVWRLVDEVRAQRTLVMAEQGQLVPHPADIDVPTLVNGLAEDHPATGAAASRPCPARR